MAPARTTRVCDVAGTRRTPRGRWGKDYMKARNVLANAVAVALFIMSTGCEGDSAGSDSGSGGFCLVQTEGESDVFSLAAIIENRYDGHGSEATCSVEPGGLEDSIGIAQLVVFPTQQLCADPTEYCIVDGNGDPRPGINSIELSGPITFDNSTVNVAIGSLPMHPPAESDYAFDYPENAVFAQKDFGVVTIDAATNFAAGDMPFVCAAGTQPVVLRSVIVRTNGIDADTFFSRGRSESVCLFDGGDVQIVDAKP